LNHKGDNSASGQNAMIAFPRPGVFPVLVKGKWIVTAKYANDAKVIHVGSFSRRSRISRLIFRRVLPVR
jgi:hypothetical protein